MSTTAAVPPATSPDVRGRARPQALPTLASSGRGPRASGPPARPATPRPLTSGSAASAFGSPRGVLELVISERGGRSIASRQFHEGALRVLRPHYLDDSGQVCYVVVNPGGAYLGADLYVLDVEVGDGADLLLTTQSATKIYRTPESFAEQRMTVRLGEGSRLQLAPDQVIAYREASYRQNTHITVRPTSSLVMAEVITPGWSPDGASFRYEELRLRNEIHVQTDGGTRLLALDNLLIRPPLDDITGTGFMEGYSHLGSLVVADARVDQALADELHQLAEKFDAYTGISLSATMDGITALVLRSLSNSTEKLNTLLGGCSGLLRQRWYGQAPLNLRKY